MPTADATFDLLKSARSNTNICHLAAKELWQRRNDLKHLIMSRSNSEGRLVDFGPLELDETASDLIAMITDVPDRLKSWDIGSPHCFETTHNPHGIFDLNFHKMFYDAGFVDMQGLRRHGRTPLAECCIYLEKVDLLKGKWTFNPSRNWFDMVVWFAERGASPDFSQGNLDGLLWPHLQFYAALATSFGRYHESDMMDIFGVRDCTFTTDLCRCSCSSNGCIPSFLIWNCSLADHRYHCNCKIRMRLRERRLEDCIKLC